MLYVTLGTGVGGGLVFDGRIWLGRNGYAGEIGHIQVEPEGVPLRLRLVGLPGDDRGHPGLGASRGGAAGVGSRVVAAPAARRSTRRSIVEAARGEDAVALEVVDDAARAVGIGRGRVLDLLNVDRVVIGRRRGSNAGFFLLERIVEETRKRTFPHVFADVTFRLAELGSDAGVVGAARVGMIGVGNG